MLALRIPGQVLLGSGDGPATSNHLPEVVIGGIGRGGRGHQNKHHPQAGRYDSRPARRRQALPAAMTRAAREPRPRRQPGRQSGVGAGVERGVHRVEFRRRSGHGIASDSSRKPVDSVCSRVENFDRIGRGDAAWRLGSGVLSAGSCWPQSAHQSTARGGVPAGTGAAMATSMPSAGVPASMSPGAPDRKSRTAAEPSLRRRRGAHASLVPQPIDEVVEAVLTGPVQRSLLAGLSEVQGEHEDRRLQEGEQGGVEGHTKAAGHLR